MKSKYQWDYLWTLNDTGNWDNYSDSEGYKKPLVIL